MEKYMLWCLWYASLIHEIDVAGDVEDEFADASDVVGWWLEDHRVSYATPTRAQARDMRDHVLYDGWV